MSKQQRKHTECLNCQHVFTEDTTDNFCSNCGQQNLNKTVSLRELAGDFVGNYLSLDSKLLRTLPRLLIFPGFLTNAFIGGKRIAYLSPIRIYLVMSVLYFSVLISQLDFSNETIAQENRQIDTEAVDSVLNTIQESALEEEGSKIFVNDEGLFQWNFSGKENQMLGRRIKRAAALSQKYGIDATMDTLQRERSIFTRNAVFTKATRQGLRIYNQGSEKLSAYFFSRLPLMMLLAIPFFAIIFKLLYARRKRFYIEHLIFLLHFHAFLYAILTLIILTSQWLSDEYIPFLVLLIFVYFFVAIKKVYQQSWPKTILKGFVFNLLYPLSLTLAIAITGLFAFMMF